MNQRFLVGLAALGLLVASVATAQVRLARTVVSAGGTVANGSGFGLQGTVGQPLIGRASGSGVNGAFGFWYLLRPFGPSAVRNEGAVTGSLDAGSIKVFPHPVVNRAEIELIVKPGSIGSLRLYDALGRMRATLLDNERIDGAIVLPAENLETGTYSLVLVVDGRQSSRTFQVRH